MMMKEAMEVCKNFTSAYFYKYVQYFSELIIFSLEFEEGVVVSKEYKGEQGRYMPPKHGKTPRHQDEEV